MAARPLAELNKLLQHQLNSIRKEDLIQSILIGPETGEDTYLALMTQLTALIAEVAELRNALTSPASVINKQVRSSSGGV